MTATRLALLAMFVITAAAGPAAAQQACPCVPTTKLWIAVSCDNWTCASSAISIGGGDGTSFAIPSANHQWIVVRQVVAGAFTDDSPFVLQSFDHGQLDRAVARLNGVGDDHQPMILTAPDGEFLVISLREPAVRRRAAR